MNEASRFWDKIADRYAKKTIADKDAYRKKLDITRGYLQPHMELLEIGCGTGATAIAHAPYVKHIRAIDFSKKMIGIARDRLETEGAGNVSFEQTDIDQLSAPGQSFDAVLALSVLHLLENRDAVISKVYELLKPGGFFISSTACLGDRINFFKYIVPIGKYLGLMPMVKIFTVKELVKSMTDVGFEIDYQWQPGSGEAVFIVAKKAV